MSSSGNSADQPRHDADLSVLLESFDAAWSSGQSPDLESFVAKSDRSERAWAELMLSDLEWRWRQRDKQGGSRDQPLIEHYLQHSTCPWNSLDDVPRSIVLAEFRIRHQWGDKPPVDDYVIRFGDAPDLPRELQAALDEVRREVADMETAIHQQPSIADTSIERTAEWSTESPTRVSVPVPPRDFIGRYQVQSILGQGAFGTIYLTHDPELDRVVAVKTCTAAEQESASLVAEARRSLAVDHAGVVRVFDVGRTDDGETFIVMEYLAGGTLGDRLGTEPWPVERVVPLFVSLARTLAFAHQHGMVHRDLKPNNILFDDEDHPKIADFGLALNESEQLGRRGELAGTVAYMSPEQIRGEVDFIDGRADIWALGVMMYELLTGRRPFQGNSFEEISTQILNRPVRPVRQWDDSVPPKLAAVVEGCLVKDVEQRFPNAGAVADALEETIASHLAAAREKRQPMGAIAFGVVVVAVALLALFLATRNNEQAPDDSSNNSDLTSSDTTSSETADESREEIGKPSQSTPAAPSLRNSIDVMIWDPDDESRRRLFLQDDGALPLQRADRVKVRVTMDRPRYAYVVWIDAEGQVASIYPGQPGSWERNPRDELAVQQVDRPSGITEFWELGGTGGVEVLLLLARDTPLPADVDLQQLVATSMQGIRLDSLPSDQSVVWFTNGRLVNKKMDLRRGAVSFDATVVDDPLLDLQQRIEKQLSAWFPVIRAVCFTVRGS